MNNSQILCKKKKIHFIGIGGVSMGALAKYFMRLGYAVSGSDIASSQALNELESQGAKIYIGHNSQNIGESQVVVYNSAIDKNNCELAFAKEQGMLILSRAQLLRYVSQMFNQVIAVSGSHGKTTTTALLGNIFKNAGKSFCAHIGGEDLELTNLFCSGNEVFITEACEYKKNFLMLTPTIAIVLNIDPDHTECYKDLGDLQSTFLEFCKSAKTQILNADDKNINFLLPSITYGIKNSSNYRARHIRQTYKKLSFVLVENGKKIGRFNLSLFGKHNVYNALAAIACARLFDIDYATIKSTLERFKGVKRRFENIGTLSGANVICDYAHHPKELESAIKTTLKLCKNVVYVFQPHTYSRTESLFCDFVQALALAKNLVIYKTYPAREEYSFNGSGENLSLSLPSCIYFDCKVKLYNYLSLKLSSKYTLVVLGAGDIYSIFYDITKQLKQNKNI